MLGWVKSKSKKIRAKVMLFFHCTKKLLQALDLPVSAQPEESDDLPLGVWYANIFVEYNTVFLLFVNDPTLYTVVLHFSGMPNATQVVNNFRENLVMSLASDGVDHRIIQRLLKEHVEAVFVKTTSRSMLGSMNDLIYLFLFHLEDDNAKHNPIDLHKIESAVNQMPQRKIGWRFSVEAMRERLQILKTD
jgi:hypothetical protein